ncbi:MAG: hypothetical protein GY749_42075, partial [Desulfobacteraceae bacterium]|nr:hypothetical protein [Desulfobacteraceae bacterium]
ENKIIVSNSSPLMNLAIIRHLYLLKEIFSEIMVPEEVWKELAIDGKAEQVKLYRQTGLNSHLLAIKSC